MKARITKGGWYSRGVLLSTGDIVDESPAWIANRQADGLAEPCGDDEIPDTSAPETASIEAPENAAMPRGKAKKGGE